jgi:hypothetical protein
MVKCGGMCMADAMASASPMKPLPQHLSAVSGRMESRGSSGVEVDGVPEFRSEPE